MVDKWSESSVHRDFGGRHAVLVTPPGGSPRDITFLRDIPIKLDDYGGADPFSDTTAAIGLPQVSLLDDPTTPELNFLQPDTAVDIYWVPSMARPADWSVAVENLDTAPHMNPLTGKPDLLAPLWNYTKVGGTYVRQRTIRGKKVWEGHVASLSASEGGWQMQCQGALFQADLTLAKPFYPPNPQTLESLILGVLDPHKEPSFRLSPPHIEWPAGYTLTAPSFTGQSNLFTPNVSPGKRWTGYTTRSTGGWDHALTGFVQGLLSVMLTKPGSGVTVGDQWTLRLAHAGDPTYPAGRTPVLKVRRTNAAPSFSYWAGARGVRVSLSADSTQAANAIYGSGTDLAGTAWRNSSISATGSRTDYAPLAAHRSVYPKLHNQALRPSRFLRESYVQYGPGFSQPDATDSASLTLSRDLEAGWSGTITVQVDPHAGMSRWEIQAGMTMMLKGFMGTGEDGLRLHVAQVECAPQDGTVTLTVDTRYRDLLTLAEAIQRNRDALTPAKLLQLNRDSVTIEDIQAPWDYTKGSGSVPLASKSFYFTKPISDRFPYTNWLKQHPPRHRSFAHWYVPCRANATSSVNRWAGPIRVLMSEKGTIRRSEFVCVDRDGNIVPIRYHVSLYYNNGISAKAMPYDGHNYSPFITGAFQSIDPSTGGPWNKPGREPDQAMVIGWGDGVQPAGYSPGLKTRGARPTGMLVDESSWTFDCSASNPNYDHLARAGKEPASVVSVFAMFYAEYDEAVYFIGRLYRESPGAQ